MNQNCPLPGSLRNSTVPAPRYPASRAMRIAASRIPFSSPWIADSSITFWLCRCTLQSRQPTAQVVPHESATIWTSMCLAAGMAFSQNTVGSPNASSASVRAEASAAAIPASSVTIRMPRPPPPVAAFSMTG